MRVRALVHFLHSPDPVSSWRMSKMIWKQREEQDYQRGEAAPDSYDMERAELYDRSDLKSAILAAIDGLFDTPLTVAEIQEILG